MDWEYYLDNYNQKKRNSSNGKIAIIVIIIIIIIVVLIIFFINKNQQKNVNTPIMNNIKKEVIHNNKDNNKIDLRPKEVIDREIEIRNNLNKVYYSEQLNPLIMGNAYEMTNYKKPIYVQRASDGTPLSIDDLPISKYGKIGYSAPRGLSEYNSAHYDKGVGNTNYIWRDGKLTNQTYDDMINELDSIDYDLYNNIAKGIYDKKQSEKNIQEISKKISDEYNGIPQDVNLPSTTILNYSIQQNNKQSDYYGIQGATISIPNGLATMFIPDHSPLS
jgi:hypothetical protein